MSKKEDIEVALATFLVTDDSVWEADGSPSLKTVQDLTGDKSITAADIDEVTGGARRPPQTPPAAPEGDASAEKPDEVTVAAPPQTHAEKEAAIVAEARTKFDVVCAEIAKLENQRGEITKTLDVLVKDKDVQAKLIEKYGPRVSFADGVKAIQRQTIERLAASKESSVLATAALKASGVNTTYPSELDKSLGTRKRSPEEKLNYAKFVHQGARRQSEGVSQ